MNKKILLILLLTSVFAQFNWKDDGAPIRQGLHIEWQRTGDSDGDGTMVYAWSDCRSGIRDVVVQKVDINGNNLWGPNGVMAVNAEGRQEDPQLVTDGEGGAFIIWMDYRDESDAEGDIYAQHILSDGSLQWGLEGTPLANLSGRQASPNICKDGEGGAFVIWKDGSQSSFGDIHATHLSNQGIIAGGVGIPIITYSSNRSSPSLNTGGGGSAVLIWSDDRNTELDLYAQRISVNGETIITEWDDGGKVVCNAEYDQTSPRITQFNGNNTIMTWEDNRNEYKEVYYQILDENGNPQLTANGNVACAGEWEIVKPRVKANNSTAFIVWEDNRNGWTSDIYAQKINSNGSIAWGNGLAINTIEGDQTEPRLTTDGYGGVFFVWEDQRNSNNSGVDIYSQHVNSSDAISYSENGILICDAANLQFNPLVRNDGNGGAFIVWGDQRSGGSFGMYIQHLIISGITLTENGMSSFFGIATDAANEPYKHDMLYLGNDETFIYWQDNRWGESKIYGSKITTSFDGDSEYFSNESINGQQLSSLPIAQKNPKAILAGNNIFLSFIVEESPNENLYFQILDLNLNNIGNTTSLSDPNSSKQGFNMVFGNDGYIYYAYSENYYITLQKLDVNGSSIWEEIVVNTSAADDIIRVVYPLPGSGCMIVYESQSVETGKFVYAMAVDGAGQSIGSSHLLSDLSGDQYYEDSAITSDGIFISFTDNTSGDFDIYGQYLTFDGNLNSGSSGIPIVNDTNDQESSSLIYNSGQNKIFICYETSIGGETDIHCKEIQLSNQSISAPAIISEEPFNQENPDVYWSGISYLIAWEDARNSSGNPDIDIYLQEYRNNNFTFTNGGKELCIINQKQERPVISKNSDSDNSYIIVWEDYRSTGKENIANLYGQSFSNCSSTGDLNCDGAHNVLDIVTLANCILAQDCPSLACGCAGDLNGDGGYNVLDIVSLANCILAQNCSGRIDDASEGKLIRIDNTLSLKADGFIGGVQMTLTHGPDFIIRLTNQSLYAEYLTKGNETRLIIVTPDTEELFTFQGEFEIVELIVANSQIEIAVDVPFIQSFNLSEAYPNPFNPTTTLTLTIPTSGDIKVQVYNLIGQMVATLANGYMEANTYTLTWDAAEISSGMYFVRAEAGGLVKTKKLMLLK